ncbi:MAG: response regulator transcription factor [Bacteroidota bacterium]
MPRILLIEDNPNFGYILKEYLSLYDFEVTLATSGEAGLEELNKSVFDLCLLDIMLPGQDGFTIAKEIQRIVPDLPFIFLTAKALKIDKLKGFRLGCDDYIVKPIDEELLVARIHAILKRSVTIKPEKSNYKIGQYTFDNQLQTLTFQAQQQTLTEREAQLLTLLCQHENQLLERKYALQTLWGDTDEFNRKSMDVFISRLRKYLSQDNQISIKNVHGRGFVLEVND